MNIKQRILRITAFLILAFPTFAIWIPKLISDKPQTGTWVEGIAATFLFTTIFGSVVSLFATWNRSRNYKLGTALALLPTFFITFLNGAVGIIGAEENPLNLIFGLVFVVGFSTAIKWRFESAGMERAMLLAAVTQAAIAVVVAGLAGYNESIKAAAGMLALNGFFASLYASSAMVFRKENRGNATSENDSPEYHPLASVLKP